MSKATPCSWLAIVDDDEDDRVLCRAALAEARPGQDVRPFAGGAELLSSLRTPGIAVPGLILLDLNMPGMDGRATLGALKADPTFRAIPVVVLTTSGAPADIAGSYALGASGFITKPHSFHQFVQILRCAGQYWFDVVASPIGARP